MPRMEENDIDVKVNVHAGEGDSAPEDTPAVVPAETPETPEENTEESTDDQEVDHTDESQYDTLFPPKDSREEMRGRFNHFPEFSHILGMEAIDFQISSKFKSKIIEVFQMAIDFRNNLDYSKIPNVESQKRLYRIRETYNYFKNKVVPRFMEVVKQETGLVINKVVCMGGPDEQPSGMFAVDLSFNDWKAAMETQGRMTGTSNYYASDRDAVEDMKKMADLWDKKSGRITKDMYAGKKIAVDMYFDVNTAYLIQDFFPEVSAEPLTAAEIAAIMCHECGHANSVIEHASDMFVTAVREETFINRLTKANDTDSLMKALKEAVPWLQRKSKEKMPTAALTEFNKRACNTLATVIQNVSQAYGTTPGTENPLVPVFGVLWNGFIAICQFICILIFDYLFVIAAVWVWYSLGKLFSFTNTSSTGGKATDFGGNYNNIFLLERWADEYVTRIGLGAELASGLNKITDYYQYNNLGPISSSILRRSTLFGCICKGYSWLMNRICFFTYLDPIGYEDLYARIKRMQQDVLAFFKSNDIPGAAADLWIRSIEDIEFQLKQAKTLSDTAVLKKVYGILNDLLNPVQIGILIANGDLYTDLARIQNYFDDLKNNKLYYLSTKLSRMG